MYPFEQKGDITNSIALSMRDWRPNLFPQYSKQNHIYNRLQNKLPFLNKVLGLWNEQEFINNLNNITEEEINPFPLYIENTNGDNILLKKYYSNVKDVFDIGLLEKSEYLIGMRLHSLIFATQMGKPFVAIGYASKIKNYLYGIDELDLFLDITNYNKIQNKIKYIKNNKKMIQQELEARTKLMEVEINNTVDEIFNKYIV